MAYLVVTEGPASGKEFAMGRDRLVLVGRHMDCSFQIADDKVSRRHLQIRLDEDQDQHFAMDYESANGVSINGDRITTDMLLNDGDAIQIGQTTLVYKSGDSPSAENRLDSLRRQLDTTELPEE